MSGSLQIYAHLSSPSALRPLVELLAEQARQLGGGQWFFDPSRCVDSLETVALVKEEIRKAGVDVSENWTTTGNTATLLPTAPFLQVMKAFSVSPPADIIVTRRTTGQVIQTAMIAQSKPRTAVDTVAAEVISILKPALHPLPSSEISLKRDVLRMKNDLEAGVGRIKAEIEAMGKRLEGSPEERAGIDTVIEEQRRLEGLLTAQGGEGAQVGVGGGLGAGETRLEETVAAMEAEMATIKDKIMEVKAGRRRATLKLRQTCDQEGHCYFSIFLRTSTPPPSVVLCSSREPQSRLTINISSEMMLIDSQDFRVTPGDTVWLAHNNEPVSNEVLISPSQAI